LVIKSESSSYSKPEYLEIKKKSNHNFQNIINMKIFKLKKDKIRILKS